MRQIKMWTPEEDSRLAVEYPKCISLSDLAKSFGVSENMLRKRAEKLRVRRSKEAISAICSASAKRSSARRLEAIKRAKARFNAETGGLYSVFAQMVRS